MFHRFAPRQGAPTAAEFVMTKTSGLYSIGAERMNRQGASARESIMTASPAIRDARMRTGVCRCGLWVEVDSWCGPTWHTADMAEPLDAIESDAFRDLSDPERAMARHSELLWRRAYQIARDNAGVDPGDVYHALRCLELEPAGREVTCLPQ
jgi:hypothetical protein